VIASIPIALFQPAPIPMVELVSTSKDDRITACAALAKVDGDALARILCNEVFAMIGNGEDPMLMAMYDWFCDPCEYAMNQCRLHAAELHEHDREIPLRDLLMLPLDISLARSKTADAKIQELHWRHIGEVCEAFLMARKGVDGVFDALKNQRWSK
jgi:hypothetical protein